MSTYQEIRTHIQADDIEEAFEAADALFEGTAYADDFSLIVRNYRRIERETALNTEDPDRLSREQNKALRTLLGMLSAHEQGEEPDAYLAATDGILHGLTSQPFRPEVFIGREADMDAVYDLLFHQSQLLLLVHGRGGIGKTTLAASYYWKYRRHYAHVGWVLSEPSLIDGVLRLAAAFDMQFDPKARKEERLEQLLTQLDRLQGPCLLIIDNANESSDLEVMYKHLRRNNHFHILLTSRIPSFREMATYAVRGLSEEKTLELFRKFYPKLQPEEESLLYQIREAVYENTLVLELLAKNLGRVNKFRVKYALQDLLHDIQNKGLLALTHTRAVGTDYQHFEKAKPEEIIEAMYDLGGLEREEVALLSIFAVLPPENIPYELLHTLIKDEPDEVLESLIEKGWLEFNEDYNAFKSSPVVQEIVRKKNEEIWEDCAYTVRVLIEGLNEENRHQNNFREAAVWVRLGEAVLSHLDLEKRNLGTLSQNIGNYYTEIGDLTLAMEMYLRMERIQKVLSESDPENTDFKNGLAISYNFLGNSYKDLGDLEKALESYEKYNQLSKELHDEYPQSVKFKNDYAISYEKLGSTHSSLG
ncbi:MAG: NB-ARC domain-containing protein, partial [Bacteroidota bacterium]